MVVLCQFFSPGEPRRATDGFDDVFMAPIVCRPPGFTKWDKTVIEGDASTTLGQFIDAVKSQTGECSRAVEGLTSGVTAASPVFVPLLNRCHHHPLNVVLQARRWQCAAV